MIDQPDLMTEMPHKKTLGPERGSVVSSSKSGRPRVLIVGGGFAGIHAARALEESPAEIWLIDRHNYQTFQPLLYQVATAGLEPGQIAHSIRGIFQDRSGPRFLMGTVVEIEPAEQVLELEDGGKITYDYLILAAGSTTEYFGIEGAGEHALPLKSLEDAPPRLREYALDELREKGVEVILGDGLREADPGAVTLESG